MILNHHHPFWSFFAPNNALPRRSQRRDGRGRGGRGGVGGVGGGKGTRKCAPPHHSSSSSSSSSSVMNTRCVLCCGDAQIVVWHLFFPRNGSILDASTTACQNDETKEEQLLNLNLPILHNYYCNNAGVPYHHHNKQPHALESGGDSLSLFERSCAKRRERDEGERKCLTSKYAR
jgi:hypothetical protein